LNGKNGIARDLVLFDRLRQFLDFRLHAIEDFFPFLYERRFFVHRVNQAQRQFEHADADVRFSHPVVLKRVVTII